MFYNPGLLSFFYHYNRYGSLAEKAQHLNVRSEPGFCDAKTSGFLEEMTFANLVRLC